MDEKILVVDNEEDIRNVVADTLETFGFHTERADGVQRALELMKSDEYDIIVADKNMPDLDGSTEGGMSLLRYARKYLPMTEFIMMTGYATVETATEAMKLGAFDYIAKPFSMSDLKEKIDRIVEYKKFLNSENNIRIYKTLHSELLSLLENRDNLLEETLHDRLRSLGTKIDKLFGAQKEWERIILAQSESLARIAGYAEQLKEMLAQSDSFYQLVEKICEESTRRIENDVGTSVQKL
jgi:DNA-binding NtrC family response regulator